MQNLARSSIFKHLRKAECFRSHKSLSSTAQAKFFSTDESKLNQKFFNGKHDTLKQHLNQLNGITEGQFSDSKDSLKQTIYSLLEKQYSGEAMSILADNSKARKTLKATKSNNDALRLYQTPKFGFSTADAAGPLTKTQILEGTQVEKDAEGKLTRQSIENIYNALVDWSREEYERVVDLCRKERRAAGSLKEYIDAIKSYDENYEKVLPKSQKELLEQLKINEQEFNDVVEGLISGGDSQLYNSQIQMHQKLQ